MKPQQKTLALLSLNINGLASCALKRSCLFGSLLKKGFDVVLLQETHHRSEVQGQSWAREGAGPLKGWNGPSFWSHGVDGKHGVAVLVKEGGLAENPVCIHNSVDGRICAITFEFLGKRHTLFNVYGPSSDPLVKRRFFLDSLLPCLPAHNCRLLIGGDFNCIGSVMDCTGGSSASRSGGYQGGLQVVVDQHNLLDVWRAQHSRRTGFTHFSASSKTGARLDRWYISQDLSNWCVAPRHPVLGLTGDHLGVRLELKAPQPSFRGPGSWRFSSSLLSQPAFVESVREEVDAVLSQPLTAFQESHCQRWVHLKNVLQLLSREWQAKLVARERAAASACSEAATKAFELWEQNPNCLAALEAFQEAQSALQESSMKKASRAALFAGLVDQHWGERSSHYFYQAAKIREVQTSFPAIRSKPSENPFALTSVPACLKACDIVADFFSGDHPEGLYRKRDTDPAAQEELLGCLDCFLTQEAKEGAEGEAEGQISLDELTAALHVSARGSSPGLDGLTYEFYRAFWDLLGPALAAMLEEVFSDPLATLPPTLTEGRVTLLHKQGKDKTLPDSYRPITLLNVDYKLIARVIAKRLAPALNSVVDSSQTAFLPERWIGDNVSAHLEEIHYLEEVKEPGVLVFLDFEKAFDRVDRDYTALCLQRLGFGPCLLRWVKLLHSNTQVLVNVNGFHTRKFPVLSGVFQGSPLSPLLYVATTQPMSAHARSLARRREVRGLCFPDGSPAPLLHLHADDTSLHTRTRTDAALLLNSTISLHCLASASKLQRNKSQGLEVGGAFSGLDDATKIQFIGPGEFVKHLGIIHSHDREADAERMYTGLLKRLENRVNLWCLRNLSLVGRIQVAKQVFVSMLTYLAGFIPPPPTQQKLLLSLIHTFVAHNRCAEQDEPLPKLYPRHAVTSLPENRGGLGMPDVLIHIASLQAKIVSRWLEPERLPWKAFFEQWFLRSPLWLTSHPHLPPRKHDVWQLGQFLPFSDYPLSSLEIPPRVRSYLLAYAEQKSHRLVPVQDLSLSDCLSERLFFNRQICDVHGKTLRGGLWRSWAQVGVVSLGAWKERQRQQLPPLPGWEVLLSSLPAKFKEALLSPVSFVWYVRPACLPLTQPSVLRSVEGSFQEYRVLQTGELELLNGLNCLSDIPQDSQAAAVMEWDNSRHYRGHTIYDMSPREVPYLLGPLSSVTLLPALWGRGTFPAHAFIVKLASRRRHILRALKDPKLRLSASEPLKPKIWSDNLSDSSAGLKLLEAHWAGSSSAGFIQPAERLPSYFYPSAPRPAPRDRSQAVLATPRPSAVPADSSAGAVDERDEAESLSPPNPHYTQVWKELCQRDIGRPARITAWRVLHGSLMVGAFFYHVFKQAPSDRLCPHSCCQDSVANLTHTFLHCPVVAPVVQYIQSLWFSIDPEAQPLPPEALLTGDSRFWAPSESLQAFWVRLRVYFLQAVWAAYQQARSPDRPPSSASIASTTLHLCHKNLRQDFLLATSGMKDPDADCPTSQLSGVPSDIARNRFFTKWGGEGVLCALEGPDKLSIIWTRYSPVNMPGFQEQP